MRCPKCDGQRIWLIEDFSSEDARRTSSGHPLFLVKSRGVDRAKADDFHGGNGRLDLVACDACGYAELWARGLEHLVHDPENGVHLFDHDPDRGPFR
ncbi:MAG: hypothetical protein R3B72_40635 [Polyangiaceae bacterium]